MLAAAEIGLDHDAAGEVDAEIQTATATRAKEARISTADSPYHTLRVFMNGKRVTL